MSIALRSLLCLSLLMECACATTRPDKPCTDVAEGARAQLAILESTDLHSNILSYDYYRLAEDQSLGFERMATLVN
ncbi:MAG: bifunctional metallophosphatase/5'-nucleotidase, partial [Dokdonella sp.]